METCSRQNLQTNPALHRTQKGHCVIHWSMQLRSKLVCFANISPPLICISRWPICNTSLLQALEEKWLRWLEAYLRLISPLLKKWRIAGANGLKCLCIAVTAQHLMIRENCGPLKPGLHYVFFPHIFLYCLWSPCRFSYYCVFNNSALVFNRKSQKLTEDHRLGFNQESFNSITFTIASCGQQIPSLPVSCSVGGPVVLVNHVCWVHEATLNV